MINWEITSNDYPSKCTCCGKETFRVAIVHVARSFKADDSLTRQMPFCSKECLEKYRAEVRLWK